MDSQTKLIGLFGYPVSHSLSPQMQNAAFQHVGLNYIYLAFPVQSERLKEAVQAIRAFSMAGANVTVPHKIEVMKYLDELDEEARLFGAVNTIVNVDGRLIGYNTDGPGYIRSLESEHNIPWGEATVTILGAGGAARGIAIAVARKGVKEVRIVNRTLERAKELAQLIGSWSSTAVYQWDQLPKVLEDTTLLINCTTVGMSPNGDETPVPKEYLHKELIVSDIIYNPLMTRLLKEAQAEGAKIHTGLGMFIHQGAIAFEKWTGHPAPVGVMEETVRRLLTRR